MRNHFATLGVEARFDLDDNELERRYRERSREVHPDRASAAERVKAMGQATELNEAFRTLKSPLKRAEHLLELRGAGIGDHDKVDQGFLLEILELREELQAAMKAGRTDDVARMEGEMRARYDGALSTVGELFRDGGDVAAIKRVLVELRYFQRFLDEVEGEEAA